VTAAEAKRYALAITAREIRQRQRRFVANNAGSILVRADDEPKVEAALDALAGELERRAGDEFVSDVSDRSGSVVDDGSSIVDAGDE